MYTINGLVSEWKADKTTFYQLNFTERNLKEMRSVGHLLTGSSINGEKLFNAGPQTVTILTAEEIVYDDATKVKLSFEETEKQLSLNKTRLAFMIGNFTDDLDNWIGEKIMLHAQKLTSGKFAGSFTILINKPIQEPSAPSAITESEIPF